MHPEGTDRVVRLVPASRKPVFLLAAQTRGQPVAEAICMTRHLSLPIAALVAGACLSLASCSTGQPESAEASGSRGRATVLEPRHQARSHRRLQGRHRPPLGRRRRHGPERGHLRAPRHPRGRQHLGRPPGSPVRPGCRRGRRHRGRGHVGGRGDRRIPRGREPPARVRRLGDRQRLPRRRRPQPGGTARQLLVDGNTVSGNLELDGNRGRISVSRNKVGGDLSCEENAPAPSAATTPCPATRKTSAAGCEAGRFVLWVVAARIALARPCVEAHEPVGRQTAGSRPLRAVSDLSSAPTQTFSPSRPVDRVTATRPGHGMMGG